MNLAEEPLEVLVEEVLHLQVLTQLVQELLIKVFVVETLHIITFQMDMDVPVAVVLVHKDLTRFQVQEVAE